jgi:aminotransferase
VSRCTTLFLDVDFPLPPDRRIAPDHFEFHTLMTDRDDSTTPDTDDHTATVPDDSHVPEFGDATASDDIGATASDDIGATASDDIGATVSDGGDAPESTVPEASPTATDVGAARAAASRESAAPRDVGSDVTAKLSDRVTRLQPSGIREFFELSETRDDVISLSVGEPDFVVPQSARRAAVDALERGQTSYTTNRGKPELRAAIARHVERYGLDYDPDREILVTTGVSEGIDLAMRALVDPGDVVAVAQPGYLSYPATVTLAGGEVLPVPTSASDDFALTYEALSRAGARRADVLVYSYPNNPTGAVLDGGALRDVAAFARDHDLVVLADEVYAALTYDGRHASIASLPGMRERTVVFNGFSKAYAMTGLRLGYAMGPPEIVGAMNRVHQYTMLSAPTTAQHAAVEALESDGGALETMRDEYDRRRRFVRDRLDELGFEHVTARGSFYVFPSVPGGDDEAFAADLLRETGVATVPGRAFGDAGRGHLRLCYATGMDDLREAFDRIESFVRARGAPTAQGGD